MKQNSSMYQAQPVQPSQPQPQPQNNAAELEQAKQRIKDLEDTIR